MKKILTIILTICLALGTFMPCAAAFKDTEGTPYEEAAALLYDLGIVEGRGSNYEPEAELTRAEMITYLVRILGLDGGAAEVIFSDVPEDHWACGNVATAYKMGIANGMGDGSFAPDAPVTFAQSVKLLVGALGYGVQAEAAGGYPSGYLAMANRIDLLKGVPQDGTMNRGIMALLAANALDISPLVKADYGADSGKYVEATGETLLSYYLNIDTYKGLVTGNEMVRVAAGTKADAGEIAMGDLVFSVGNTNAAAFVGQEVTIRAKEEDNTLVILHIAAKKGTTVFTASGEDILPTTEKTRLVLEDADGNKSTIEITGDANFVYNGMYKAPWAASDLLSPKSTYTFVQNTNGIIYTIFQERYENHVVKSTSEDLQKVYYKDGGSLSVSPSDWSKIQITKADGTAAALSDMAEWDILSVSVGGTDAVLRAILSKERVEGTVSEKSDDEVVIGEKTYKIAKSLSENALEEQPKVGQTAFYSIDAFGLIAAVNTDTLTKKYAYLVEGNVKPGLDVKAQVKLFTKEGKMEVYTLADKVRLDDAAPIAATAVLEDAKLSAGGAIIRQLITYELNGENEINAIEVAENSEGVYDREERLHHFTMDHEVTGTGGRFVGHSSSKFASRYQIADKTIIMVVPKTSNEDSMYKILTKKNLVHGEGYAGVSLYDVDKNNVVSVMVQNIDAEAVVDKECQVVAMVLYPTETVDADGVVQPALRVLLPDGTETTLPVLPEARVETNRYVTTNKGGIKATMLCVMNSSDPYYRTEPDAGTLYNFMPLSQLEKGDIIQYETNVNGVVSALAVRVRAKRLNPLTDMIERNTGDLHLDYAWSSFQYMYGEVIAPVENGVVVKSNCINTSTSERHENVERLLTNTVACTYLYEKGKDTVRKILSADLIPGDKIAMTHTIASTIMLIAYRD